MFRKSEERDLGMYCQRNRRRKRCAERYWPPVPLWKRFVIAWVLRLVSAICASNAFAITLDDVLESSSLGEPLQLVIGLGVRSDETISRECVRIVPSQTRIDDALPQITVARVDLEQSAGKSRLVITSRRAIMDLAMRLTVQAQCETPVIREYVVLFDPPIVGAQSDIATPAARSVSQVIQTQPTGPASAQNGTPAASEATVPRASLSDKVIPKANVRAHSTQLKEGADTSRPPASSSVTKQKAAREEPSLRVSRTIEPPGRGASAHRFNALPEREQLAVVLEQEAVLRQRVADLSIQFERMQQERIAWLTSEIAQLQEELRAREARERAQQVALRASAWKLAPWLEQGFTALEVPLIIAVLIAGVCFWRARRSPRSQRLMGKAPKVRAFDTMEPNTEDESSLFDGPYVSPLHVRQTRPGVTDSGKDESTKSSKESAASFDEDINLVSAAALHTR